MRYERLCLAELVIWQDDTQRAIRRPLGGEGRGLVCCPLEVLPFQGEPPVCRWLCFRAKGGDTARMGCKYCETAKAGLGYGMRTCRLRLIGCCSDGGTGSCLVST